MPEIVCDLCAEPHWQGRFCRNMRPVKTDIPLPTPPSGPGQDCVTVQIQDAYASPAASGTSQIRIFDTGATRDTDTNKYDYEGFLSPAVLERYAAYMHYHRRQSDGTLRASDNWQKGIPQDVYMKSMWRHFMDVWRSHREGRASEEALCALLFNVMGLLHEVLRSGE